MKILIFLLATAASAATIPTCNTGFAAGCTPDTNTDPAALTVDGQWIALNLRLDAYIMTDTWPADGPYLPGDANSGWITNTSNMSTWTPVGVHFYGYQFDLAGYDPATARIEGKWMSDNNGIGIWLNAVHQPNPMPNYEDFFGAWRPFIADTGFLPGQNMLVFGIFNGPLDGPSSPSGIRVELNLTADAQHTPEGSTFAMAGAALLLLCWRLRKV